MSGVGNVREVGIKTLLNGLLMLDRCDLVDYVYDDRLGAVRVSRYFFDVAVQTHDRGKTGGEVKVGSAHCSCFVKNLVDVNCIIVAHYYSPILNYTV